MKHVSSRKFFLPFAAGILMFLLGGCAGGEETYRHEAPPQERTFVMLNDYGTWIDVPEFGTVWRPRVVNDWRPYAYGHWEWSDRGWIWIGYEPFSWVVYHYGSWYDDREYGWLWVPSYDWSPARVSWRSSGEYTGWAPTPPQGALLPQPGDPYWEQSWVVVPNSDFTQQDVVQHNVSHDASNTGRVRGGTQQPPDAGRVGRGADGTGRGIKVDHDHIVSGGHDLLRLRLPQAQEQNVKLHESDVNPLIMRSGPGTGVQEGRPPQSDVRRVTPTPESGPATQKEISRPRERDLIPKPEPPPESPPDKKARVRNEERPAPGVDTGKRTPPPKQHTPKKDEKGKSSKPSDKKKDVR